MTIQSIKKAVRTFTGLLTIAQKEWNSDDEFSRTGFSSVELPRDNPGLYQITAYTKIYLEKDGKELTKPANPNEIRRNKRSIKSIWFDVRSRRCNRADTDSCGQSLAGHNPASRENCV